MPDAFAPSSTIGGMELRAEVVDISGVRKKLAIVIPADEASRQLEKMAEQFRRQAALPGFRRGKVPLPLIKRRYAAEIREEVVQNLVPDSLQQAIREKGLRVLGRPRVEQIRLEQGEPLTFEAQVEVYPEFQIPTYRGLEVEVASPEIQEEQILERLEKMRVDHAQLVAVEDRPVAEGDSVMIDLNGEYADLDGGKPAGQPVEQEDVTVEVGDPSTFPAFTEALLGANIGEERTFEVEYPEDYQSRNLAGRKLRFRVEVTDIRCKELPELNDEFARDLGEFESLEDVKARIRTDLERAAKQSREGEIRAAVRRRLAESADFEVPAALIDMEMKRRLQYLAGDLAERGIDPARARIDWKKLREDMLPVVTADLRADLILDEIGNAENLLVTEADIDGEINAVVENSSEAAEKVQAYFADPEVRDGLRVEMVRRRALQVVVDSAVVM